MKKLLLLICCVLITTAIYADELLIPFSCWPLELQEAFAKVGKKLDLDSSKRTEDSWAYLVNKGSNYIIYTYRSASQEDFEIIQEIVFRIELQKRK